MGWSSSVRLRHLDSDRRDFEARRISASLIVLAFISALAYLPIMLAVTTHHAVDSDGEKCLMLPEWMINSKLALFLLVLPGIVGYALGLCRIRLPLADRLSGMLGFRVGDVEISRGVPKGRQLSGWLWALGISLGVIAVLLIQHPSHAAGLSFTRELLFPFLH